jgi:hypothetical protein
VTFPVRKSHIQRVTRRMVVGGRLIGTLIATCGGVIATQL